MGLVTERKSRDFSTHWISEDPTGELVKYLIEQLLMSAKVKTKIVSCLLTLRATLNVIRRLHKSFPDGILQPNKEVMFPVHDAFEGVPSLELVIFFL